MPAVYRLLSAALAVVALTTAARGQGSPWFGEDALVLSRGMVRLGIAPTWTRFDERYRADGEAEPLAADLQTESLDPTRLSILAPVRQRLEALGPTPDIAVSLGRLRVDHDASIFSVPLTAELGIGARLSLGIMVPIVRTRSGVLLSPNPSVSEGNIGLNPALDSEDARAVNQALLAQFAGAIGALETLIEECADPGNPDPRCPEARTPEAQELVDNASAFASGIDDLYSEAGSPFVPVTGSPFDVTIRGRVTSFAQAFAGFDINAITSTGPQGATMAGYADVLRVLTAPLDCASSRLPLVPRRASVTSRLARCSSF